MLKSWDPHAMRTAEHWLQRRTSSPDQHPMFALTMPVETPKPTDPHPDDATYGASGDGYPRLPDMDRRHHYIWRYEYRQPREQHRTTVDTKTKTETENGLAVPKRQFF